MIPCRSLNIEPTSSPQAFSPTYSLDSLMWFIDTRLDNLTMLGQNAGPKRVRSKDTL